MEGSVKLEFFGRMADRHELDLYDAGRSVEGLGRTLSILGHYYQTGKIIHQAPSSQVELALKPPEQGSFLFDVAVNATGAFIAGLALIPIGFYLNHVMGQWLPGGASADRARVARLRGQLEAHAARIDGLENALRVRDQLDQVEDNLKYLNQFIADHRTEHDVMRSITAPSFANIYRPIGRSANYATLYGDAPGAYAGTVDLHTVEMLQSDVADDELSEVRAVVNSFSRTSKVGIAFSNEMGRGFRFHYGQMGKLGKEDDFSWSQYRQREVLMSGRFYRFFDGTIKKLEVLAVERLGSDAD